MNGEDRKICVDCGKDCYGERCDEHQAIHEVRQAIRTGGEGAIRGVVDNCYAFAVAEEVIAMRATIETYRKGGGEMVLQVRSPDVTKLIELGRTHEAAVEAILSHEPPPAFGVAPEKYESWHAERARRNREVERTGAAIVGAVREMAGSPRLSDDRASSEGA